VHIGQNYLGQDKLGVFHCLPEEETMSIC